MDDLMAMERAIIGLLDAVGPSLARVDGRRGYPLSGVAYAPDPTSTDLASPTPVPTDLILTTSRAAERDEGLRVGLPSGETVAAALVGRDPGTDLALLRLAGGTLPALRWADAAALRVGQLAVRAGRTEGGLRATLGLLGGVGPAWRSPWGGRLAYRVHTDAAPFRGFSGGPLLTLRGEAVGLGTAALDRRGDAVIPAATLHRVAAALLAHGRVRRGYLGVSGQPVRLPPDVQERQGQRGGLLLTAVEPDSPAAAAGLALGDVILSVALEPVHHPRQLFALLDDESVGRALPVAFLRGGEVLERTVTVGARP